MKLCVLNYAMQHLIIFDKPLLEQKWISQILICISKFGLLENIFLENVLVWSTGQPIVLRHSLCKNECIGPSAAVAQFHLQYFLSNQITQ